MDFDRKPGRRHQTEARRIVLGGAGTAMLKILARALFMRTDLRAHCVSTVKRRGLQLIRSGSTIFERALLDEVIEAKPDAVLLYGFNEALYTISRRGLVSAQWVLQCGHDVR